MFREERRLGAWRISPLPLPSPVVVACVNTLSATGNPACAVPRAGTASPASVLTPSAPSAVAQSHTNSTYARNSGSQLPRPPTRTQSPCSWPGRDAGFAPPPGTIGSPAAPPNRCPAPARFPAGRFPVAAGLRAPANGSQHPWPHRGQCAGCDRRNTIPPDTGSLARSWRSFYAAASLLAGPDACHDCVPLAP